MLKQGDGIKVRYGNGKLGHYIKSGIVKNIYHYGVLVEMDSGYLEFFNLADFIVKDKVFQYNFTYVFPRFKMIETRLRANETGFAYMEKR